MLGNTFIESGIFYITTFKKLPTKFVIAILAVGILVGAGITATIMSVGSKPANLALAQVPMQQHAVAPAAANPPPSAGPPFGPNCAGCITTQNLANGAVTNPKLGPLLVSSANIGAGQVATGNIADQAVTTAKIAPGAVKLSSAYYQSTTITTPPNSGGIIAEVFCPDNTTQPAAGTNYNLYNLLQKVAYMSIFPAVNPEFRMRLPL